MGENFDVKLKLVADTIRYINMDNPHQRYEGGLLYWSNKAEQLHDAAMALGGEPCGLHFESFALLAGFSLEALLKGILMGLDGTVPHKHNLVLLSEQAGLAPSDDDREVLKKLTIYTTWRSRYPVAKNWRETHEGMETLRSGRPQSGTLKTLYDELSRSPLIVNEENYERLYGFYLQRFFEVQSLVCESATHSAAPRPD